MRLQTSMSLSKATRDLSRRVRFRRPRDTRGGGLRDVLDPDIKSPSCPIEPAVAAGRHQCVGLGSRVAFRVIVTLSIHVCNAG